MPWCLYVVVVCVRTKYICELLWCGADALVRNRKGHVDYGIFFFFFWCDFDVSMLTIDMDKGVTWANLFFSDNPPEFVGELDGNPKFRPFTPDDEQ